MKKEQWEKPELVVLLRNHPEETLTQIKCKNPNIGHGFENDTNDACAEFAGTGKKCFNSSGGS